MPRWQLFIELAAAREVCWIGAQATI